MFFHKVLKTNVGLQERFQQILTIIGILKVDGTVNEEKFNAVLNEAIINSKVNKFEDEGRKAELQIALRYDKEIEQLQLNILWKTRQLKKLGDGAEKVALLDDISKLETKKRNIEQAKTRDIDAVKLATTNQKEVIKKEKATEEMLKQLRDEITAIGGTIKRGKRLMDSARFALLRLIYLCNSERF